MNCIFWSQRVWSEFFTSTMVFSGTENTIVEVKNSDHTLWLQNMQFITQFRSLRYGPAIHVNQEGYLINLTEGGNSVPAPQRAIIGYYCGSLSAPIPPASI